MTRECVSVACVAYAVSTLFRMQSATAPSSSLYTPMAHRAVERVALAVCGIERVARSMLLYAALRVSLYAPVCAIERVARCMRLAA